MGLPDLTRSTSSKFIRDVKAYLKRGLARERAPEARSARLPRETALEWEEREPRRETAANSPQVFFIVGYGKSGTTWLKTLLNAHPEVLCKGEGRFFTLAQHFGVGIEQGLEPRGAGFSVAHDKEDLGAVRRGLPAWLPFFPLESRLPR